jgi:hypothetical protein
MKLRLLLLLIVFICSLSIPVSAQTPRYARVISANANLRDTPSIAAGSEQEVAVGTVVKVLDKKLPWYVVRVGNRVGWMHGNTIGFIRTEDSASEPRDQPKLAPDQTSAPRPVQGRESSPDSPKPSAGSYVRPTTDRGYIRGPRGGCYYLSGSGRKVYVDRSLCN